MKIVIDNPNKIFNNLNLDYDGIQLIPLDNNILESNINTISHQHNADLVLILQNDLAHRIRKKSKALNKNIIIPKEAHLMHEDKSYFLSWMQDQDFSYLLPMPIDNQPAVLKRGHSRGGQEVVLYNSYLDAKTHAAEGDVIQRAVPGFKELAIHVIASHGELTDITVFEHDFSSVTSNNLFIRGHALKNKTIQVSDFQFTKDIQKILQTMAFHGVACFDGKIENNQLFLFEMNTRIGGSMLFYNHKHHKLRPFLESIKQSLII